MNIKNPKILNKLNGLLIMNHEVETTYIEALEYVYKDNLETYFRARSLERKEFTKALQIEIKKFDKKPENFENQNIDFSEIRTNFKNFLLFKRETDLINEVYEIKNLTIKAYNNLLVERDSPLSLCKLLVKHRDQIQDSLIAMRRERLFVA